MSLYVEPLDINPISNSNGPNSFVFISITNLPYLF